MKAGRSNQEAPACRRAGLIEAGSIREPVFGVKVSALARPSCRPSPPAMQEGQASVTALGAAGHRAAHQVLERGFVFADLLPPPTPRAHGPERLPARPGRPGGRGA